MLPAQKIAIIMSLRQDSKVLTAARIAGAAAVCKADFEVKSAAPLKTLNGRLNSTIIVNTVKHAIHSLSYAEV